MNQKKKFSGGLTKKVGGQFKNSICDDVFYELEALLLNLNYKFDQVSGDIYMFKY